MHQTRVLHTYLLRLLLPPRVCGSHHEKMSLTRMWVCWSSQHLKGCFLGRSVDVVDVDVVVVVGVSMLLDVDVGIVVVGIVGVGGC